MNIDYCHHDTKTLNENYLKVIEGSSMYYEWYVKNLQQELQRKDNIINELKEWLKYKKEQMEQFDLDKRKETGAFWYSTMGDIETFLDKIKEIESK